MAFKWAAFLRSHRFLKPLLSPLHSLPMNQHVSSCWENPWAPNCSCSWGSLFLVKMHAYITVISRKAWHHRGHDSLGIRICIPPLLASVAFTLSPGLNHHHQGAQILFVVVMVCGETLAMQLAPTFESQLSEPPGLYQNQVQIIYPVTITQSCWQTMTLLWNDQWLQDCRKPLVFRC